MRRIDVDEEIVLRVPGIEDAAEYFAVLDRNRDYVGKWDGSRTKTRSIEVAEELITRWTKVADEGSAFHYVIEYRDSIVGSIGAMRLQEPEHVAELGYWLSEDTQGRGIVTRSARALIRRLFEDRGINLVEIWAAAENAKSRAVPERLGFKLDGYLRDRMLENGRYHDAAVYSILAREWSAS